MKEKEFECIITRGMFETAQELENEEGVQISHAYLTAILAYTYNGDELKCEGEYKCLKYPLRYAFKEIDAKREYCEKQSANGKKNGKKRAGTDKNEEKGGGEVTCYVTTEQGTENMGELEMAKKREQAWLQELENDRTRIEEIKRAYDFITEKDIVQFCKQCELRGKIHKDKADLYAHCANAMGILNGQRGRNGRDIYGKIAGAYERRTEEFTKHAAAKLAASDPNENATIYDLPFGETAQETAAQQAETAAQANEADEVFISCLDNEFKGITTGKRIMAFYWGDCKKREHWVTSEDEQQADIMIWARSRRNDIAEWERILRERGA